MKKILCILIAVAFFLNGYSQLDSSINIFNDLRLNQWAKKSNVPAWQIDGYRAIIFNGDTLVRINSGIFQAEEAKVYANGSNMSSALQDAFDYTSIKWLSFGSDSSRTYVFNSSINAHGKTLEFKNGNKLSGTATIDSLTISASDYDKVFDTTLNFTNLKSVKGYITPQQFGAKGDGISDDTRYFQKAHDIAANNGLEFVIPSGTYSVAGEVSIRDNGTIIGKQGSKILKGQGTAFRYSGAADNVRIEGLTIEMQALSGNDNVFFLGDTTTKSYGLIFNNNKIQSHRLSGTIVVVNNVNNIILHGNSVDSSDNKGIEFKNVVNADVAYNSVTNNGRSGINVQDGNRAVNVHHNYGRGSAQTKDLTDGVFDIYGPDNEDITFESNYAESGNTAYLNHINHVLFRFHGCKGLKVYDNIAVSTSPYLLYSFRFSARDGINMYNIEASGNKVYIKGGNYNRLISVQDIKNLSYKDFKVVIDSSATADVNAALFYVTSGVFLDTMQVMDASGGNIEANGKVLRMIGHAMPIKYVNFNNTTALDLVSDWYLTSAIPVINSVSWIGGRVRSWKAGSTFALTSNVRSFKMIGVDVDNPSGIIFSGTSGNNSSYIFANNTINGVRSKEMGGGIYATPTTNNAANITVLDATGVLYTNRTTSNQTVTLPTAADWTGRVITIVSQNTGSYYTLVSGDTLRTGESLMYHSDGSAWSKISSKGTTAGGGTSYDDTALRDSLTAHGVRLDSLEKNDIIPYNFYRGASGVQMDSLYVDIQDTTLSVYAPLATGDDYVPTFGNYTNTSSVTNSRSSYTRIGDKVHVWVYATFTPTSGTSATGFTISLPIASDFTSAIDLVGHISGEDGIGYFGNGTVKGSSGLDVAAVNFTCATAVGSLVMITFDYTIN